MARQDQSIELESALSYLELGGRGKKNQILLWQVLKKVHLLAERIIVLCPGIVPFSMGNTEALKALEDWEKQQRHSDFHSLSSHQSHLSDFPNSHFGLGIFSPLKSESFIQNWVA